MNLWQDFLTNDGKPIHKWPHYFPIYERHFAPWRNRSLTFLEIGVSEGGSLQMWQRYFGPLARIVGVDLNPACQAHDAPPGICVRIGDQSDHAFLQRVVDEFGVPDLVLDDGSHHMAHIGASFQFLYPRMHKNAVYMIEDLHTAYWPEFGGGLGQPNTFMIFAKHCVDRINAHHTRGQMAPDLITQQTLGISFYDSVVCFEKGEIFNRKAIKIPRKDG